MKLCLRIDIELRRRLEESLRLEERDSGWLQFVCWLIGVHFYAQQMISWGSCGSIIVISGTIVDNRPQPTGNRDGETRWLPLEFLHFIAMFLCCL